jgi:hypothetical protein
LPSHVRRPYAQSKDADWGLLDSNPAKRGIRNVPRPAREKRPLASWQQIEKVAAKHGPVDGPTREQTHHDSSLRGTKLSSSSLSLAEA